jgi:hypothetical protein
MDRANQAAIAALFRVVNRYVGNLAPMSGVFPDYPAPVIRNTDTGHAFDAFSTPRRRPDKQAEGLNSVADCASFPLGPPSTPEVRATAGFD